MQIKTCERNTSVRKNINRVRNIVNHQRLEHIELEVSLGHQPVPNSHNFDLGSSDGNSRVVAEHLGAHHCHGLTLRWVDFPWHDGRAWLVGRQSGS